MSNPFRYCGYQFDGETGFYYLKYRYYYPVIGRFLTKDPMMSYNRYMYCSNNPVNFVDLLGLANTLEEGGSYEKLTYIPFKYPSSKNGKKQTGTFISEDSTLFPDFPAPRTEQFTAPLKTPIKVRNGFISATLTDLKVETYYVYGSKQVRVDYYGTIDLPLLEKASDYLAAAGLIAIAAPKLRLSTGIEKISKSTVLGFISGAYALNKLNNVKFSIENEVYVLN